LDLQLDITNQGDLPDACSKLLDFAGDSRVFAFTAPMGAGKTTIIKQLCRSLGSEDHFSSPTYSIVNEYHSPAGIIYHFDLYRIRTIDELFDLGFEEYISSNRYCFIEWPQLAVELLPKSYLDVTIVMEDGKRLLSVVKY
jgi:tRNA threonylcarbamoyladenosine biosynthesis protein TsaE